jgi:pimeloyl-ACP methyl ester carboxylesterase
MKSLLLLIFLLILSCVQLTQAKTKTYVLVHGAWHGAWCWYRVVPLLEAKGNKVVAMDLPGHGDDKTAVANVQLSDYVDKVVEVVRSLKGPVILVGHSMAGVVIAQAAEVLGKEKVEQLIFLDAFMPDDGESVFSLAEKAARANATSPNAKPGISLTECLIFSNDQKTSKVKSENAVELFYHDCTTEDIALAQKNLGWEPMACLATPVKVTTARYGAIPKVYILCTAAKDLDKSSLVNNVPSQKVIKLPSSHSPFFSMPEALVKILEEI